MRAGLVGFDPTFLGRRQSRAKMLYQLAKTGT